MGIRWVCVPGSVRKSKSVFRVSSGEFVGPIRRGGRALESVLCKCVHASSVVCQHTFTDLRLSEKAMSGCQMLKTLSLWTLVCDALVCDALVCDTLVCGTLFH